MNALQCNQPIQISKAVRCWVDRPYDRRLLARELGGKFDNDACILGYESKDGLLVVHLSNYTKNLNIGMGLAGFGKWAYKSIFNHLFHYIFDVLNVKRVSVLIRPDNHKSLKLAKQLGFVRECNLRGMNYSQLSLLKSDTKYYERIK